MIFVDSAVGCCKVRIFSGYRQLPSLSLFSTGQRSLGHSLVTELVASRKILGLTFALVTSSLLTLGVECLDMSADLDTVTVRISQGHKPAHVICA